MLMDLRDEKEPEKRMTIFGFARIGNTIYFLKFILNYSIIIAFKFKLKNIGNTRESLMK